MPCRSKEFPKRLGANQVPSTCRGGIHLIWNGTECLLERQILPTTHTRPNGSFTSLFREQEASVPRMVPPKLDLAMRSFSAPTNPINLPIPVGKTSFTTWLQIIQ